MSGLKSSQDGDVAIAEVAVLRGRVAELESENARLRLENAQLRQRTGIAAPPAPGGAPELAPAASTASATQQAPPPQGLQADCSRALTLRYPNPGRMGLTLRLLTGGGGARITRIDPSCTLGKSLRVGDVLLTINGRTLNSAEDFGFGRDGPRLLAFRVARTAAEVASGHISEGGEQQAGDESAQSAAASTAASASWREGEDLFNCGLSHNDIAWNARYRELEAFKAEHGNCNIRRRQGSLGEWVKNQRKAHREGKLSEERFRKLDGLGVDWGATYDPRRMGSGSWDERLDELKKYKAEHGNCTVPCKQGTLGKWANNQRWARRKGKLSEECVRKLDDLGFNWGSSHDETWDEHFDELTHYKAEHGHCNVSRREGSLGQWVRNQRKADKKGKLSEGRKLRLDAIGFEWSLRSFKGRT